MTNSNSTCSAPAAPPSPSEPETASTTPSNSPSSPNKSFDTLGAQFVWDSTSLKLAEECARKYQYVMIEGWQRDGKSVHLLFGGAFATALEHFYKHLALGVEREEALEKVVLEALIYTWYYEYELIYLDGEVANDLTKPIPGSGEPWKSDHPAKTRENLIRTIIWYVDHFSEDALSVVKLSDGKPAVEYSFKLPVDNDIIFSGHIDRLVQYDRDIMVMDQKTTGTTITQAYFNQFAPDIQMSMYTFAGRAIYQMPVKGVIIDAAQIAVGFTQFGRGFTFRTEGQLNEWYDEMLALIERTRAFTLDAYFPMNRNACGNYGGCPFRPVCSRSPDVRPNFLAADFVRGQRWDPAQAR